WWLSWRKEGKRFRLRFHARDVVICIVSGEHDAEQIEADAVGQAAVRELDENFTFPVRRNLAYGRLARQTHGKDIACTVASWRGDSPPPFPQPGLPRTLCCWAKASIPMTAALRSFNTNKEKGVQSSR